MNEETKHKMESAAKTALSLKSTAESLLDIYQDYILGAIAPELASARVDNIINAAITAIDDFQL